MWQERDSESNFPFFFHGAPPNPRFGGALFVFRDFVGMRVSRSGGWDCLRKVGGRECVATGERGSVSALREGRRKRERAGRRGCRPLQGKTNVVSLTKSRRERARTPHPPRSGPPSPAGEGEGAERWLGLPTEGWRENGRCGSSGAPTPTGKNKCCIFDEKSAEERAHSSSTAERSPFSSRRRHGVERWLGLPTEGRRERERAGRRGRRSLQVRGGQICLLRWEKVAAEG